MARFGIDTRNAYGVSVSQIRALAKEIGKNHSIAQEFWSTGNHEARILVGMVDSPLEACERQNQGGYTMGREWLREEIA